MAAIFDAPARETDDCCYINGRADQNTRIFDHMLYTTNDYYCVSEQQQNVREFGVNNARGYRVGYGEAVLCDRSTDGIGMSRHGYLVQRDRCRTERASVRKFAAPPNLCRGPGKPDVESSLQQGLGTADRRCRSSEVSIDRFVPLLPCVEQYIESGADSIGTQSRYGESTRDVDNQRDFFRKMGYHFDGKVWAKKMCDATTPTAPASTSDRHS